MRALLGPPQIGRTCHDSRHLAMEAGGGADYVAFGAFYETTTKRSNYRPDPSILSWWVTPQSLRCHRRDHARNAPPLIPAGPISSPCARRCVERDPSTAFAAFNAVMGQRRTHR
jgi:thiamine-phosphate pyrophosphorylase